MLLLTALDRQHVRDRGNHRRSLEVIGIPIQMGGSFCWPRSRRNRPFSLWSFRFRRYGQPRQVINHFDYLNEIEESELSFSLVQDSICLIPSAQQCPDYKLSSRIVAALWCLTSVILVNSYTTTLVSYMTSTKLVPVIDSIEDLAAKPDYQFMVETSTSFESTMLVRTPIKYNKLSVYTIWIYWIP